MKINGMLYSCDPKKAVSSVKGTLTHYTTNTEALEPSAVNASGLAFAKVYR